MASGGLVNVEQERRNYGLGVGITHGGEGILVGGGLPDFSDESCTQRVRLFGLKMSPWS